MDWVVLSSALVGLGLAVMSVVAGGVGSLSQDTSDGISSTPIFTEFAVSSTLFDSDFADGIGGWLGGAATSLLGFGDVLMLDEGETASLTLDVPDGADSATISFDLISGDDLDEDPATIMINGQVVAIHVDDHGNLTVSDESPAGISVSVQHQAQNEPLGAGSHGHDSLSTYTITVDDPGSTLTLSVNAGTDEPTDSEFYALDNVSVVAE